MIGQTYYDNSARSSVRRHPERAVYDRERVWAILDQGLVAHVGVVTELGPIVIPMVYARSGDMLYLHGSPASRLLGTLADGVAACVDVTLVDGLVLARSAMHHSLNYRSVTAFGRARAVVEAGDKAEALSRVVDHLAPGRSGEVRPPSRAELAATAVISFTIDEASAKVRCGPPVDKPADLALEVWAGELPLALVAGPPRGVVDLVGELAVPTSRSPDGPGDRRRYRETQKGGADRYAGRPYPMIVPS